MVDPNPRAPRRWLRLVLVLSLALNLAVLGLAVGAWLRFGPGGHGHGHVESVGAELVRALPRADRRALREAMHGGPEGRRPPAAALADIDAALRARPFDAAALLALLTAQAAERAAWQDAVQAAWLERIAAMSDAERAAYADRLQAAVADRRERHRAPRRESR